VVSARYRRAVVTSPLRRLAVSPLAVLAVVLAAGCGSSAKSSGDPAAVVPARAPAYVEATIPAAGQERDDALAAARKVLGTSDPVAQLQRLLRDAGKGDVQPWIGDRVGAFSLAGSGGGATVAAASDVAAARDWVKARGTRTESYKDVELRLDAKGTAYAVVDDRVVAGARAAVRVAVDAASGDALADAKAFTDALGRVQGGDGVGRAYLAPRAILEASGASSMSGGGMFGSLAAGALTGALPTAVAAKFHADGDAVRADVATVGGAQSGARANPDVLAAVTGRAWLATAVGDVGSGLQGQLGGADAILSLVGAQAGLDIRKDLLGWMGDGAFFVAGDSPAALGGALVVRSEDPAASRAAVPKLGALISRFATGATVRELHAQGVDAGISVRMQGLPAQLQIAAAGDRFVIAAGRGALQEAISPSSRLGDDADFRSAAATLGGGLRPTSYVGISELARLGSLLARRAHEDPGDVRETLARFTALVAADQGDGRLKASLGLR
jgi:hypothetical protein